MKSRLLIFTIALLLNSCCPSSGYVIPMIRVEYPNLTEAEEVFCIRFDSQSNYEIIDTIQLGMLHKFEPLIAMVGFEQKTGNFI